MGTVFQALQFSKVVTGITDSTSVTATFAHTILVNGHSVHVLSQGNGSQWWGNDGSYLYCPANTTASSTLPCC